MIPAMDRVKLDVYVSNKYSLSSIRNASVEPNNINPELTYTFSQSLKRNTFSLVAIGIPLKQVHLSKIVTKRKQNDIFFEPSNVIASGNRPIIIQG